MLLAQISFVGSLHLSLNVFNFGMLHWYQLHKATIILSKHVETAHSAFS